MSGHTYLLGVIAWLSATRLLDRHFLEMLGTRVSTSVISINFLAIVGLAF